MPWQPGIEDCELTSWRECIPPVKPTRGQQRLRKDSSDNRICTIIRRACGAAVSSSHKSPPSEGCPQHQRAVPGCNSSAVLDHNDLLHHEDFDFLSMSSCSNYRYGANNGDWLAALDCFRHWLIRDARGERFRKSLPGRGKAFESQPAPLRIQTNTLLSSIAFADHSEKGPTPSLRVLVRQMRAARLAPRHLGRLCGGVLVAD